MIVYADVIILIYPRFFLHYCNNEICHFITSVPIFSLSQGHFLFELSLSFDPLVLAMALLSSSRLLILAPNTIPLARWSARKVIPSALYALRQIDPPDFQVHYKLHLST